jgi:hypothetical protein
MRAGAASAPVSGPPVCLLAHEHQCGFPFQVQVRLAADVYRNPVDRAAGEAVGRLARIVVGDGLAGVPADVQAGAGDGERAVSRHARSPLVFFPV